MRERITIHNDTGRPLHDVLVRVAQVIAGGNVSSTAGRAHPCHLTQWPDGVMVLCRPTRAGNLSFTVEVGDDP